MVRALAGVVVALPLLAGTDDAQARALQGVWEGTLGAQNIVACFNGDTAGSGSYYYLRYLKPIQLQREKDGAGWFESRYDSKASKDVKTGSWSLQTMDNGRLKGEWKNPEGSRSLPLELAQISDEGGELPCASNSYNDRLETVQPVAVGKQEVFEGKPFRRLRAGGEETLELLVDGPGIAKINRVLRSKLPRTKAAMQHYFATRREFLGRTGLAAEDETYAEPTYWTVDWVTVRDYRWAAGYGANGITQRFRTWDARSGEEIDPWTWVGAHSDPDTPGIGSLPAKLKAFLAKGYEPDSACKENNDIGGSYFLTLEKTGLRFWVMPDGSGCDKDFLVPYAKLSPFLTERGRAAVTRIVGTL